VQLFLDALSVGARFSAARKSSRQSSPGCTRPCEKSALSTSVLLHTLAESPPLSVTMAERMAALRAWAQKRCVPAH
jgi:hypothetical protein